MRFRRATSTLQVHVLCTCPLSPAGKSYSKKTPWGARTHTGQLSVPTYM